MIGWYYSHIPTSSTITYTTYTSGYITGGTDESYRNEYQSTEGDQTWTVEVTTVTPLRIQEFGGIPPCYPLGPFNIVPPRHVIECRDRKHAVF